MDRHTGVRWFKHDTKHRQDNKAQILKQPCNISYYLEMQARYNRISWQQIWFPIIRGGPKAETSLGVVQFQTN